MDFEYCFRPKPYDESKICLVITQKSLFFQPVVYVDFIACDIMLYTEIYFILC